MPLSDSSLFESYLIGYGYRFGNSRLMFLFCNGVKNIKIRIRDYMKPGVLKSFINNSKILMVLFDYDGTLTPIVNNPTEAFLSNKNFDCIKAFLTKTILIFAIVSGRDEKALLTLLRHNGNDLGEISKSVENYYISSSHGYRLTNFNTDDTTSLKITVNMEELNSDLDKVIVEQGLASGYNIRIEKKESSTCVHYRPYADQENTKEAQDKAQFVYTTLKPILEDLLKRKYDSFHVKEGKMVLELIDKRVSKAGAVKTLLEKVPKLINGGSLGIICAGDDKTDYDMFRELKRITKDKEYRKTLNLGGFDMNVLNIKVGEEVDSQLEDIRVETVEEFMELLRIV